MVKIDRDVWSRRVKVDKHQKRFNIGGSKTTPWWALGMALQVMGVMTLVALSGIRWGTVPMLAMMSMVGGEIIFIISKGHKGPTTQGERVK